MIRARLSQCSIAATANLQTTRDTDKSLPHSHTSDRRFPTTTHLESSNLRDDGYDVVVLSQRIRDEVYQNGRADAWRDVSAAGDHARLWVDLRRREDHLNYIGDTIWLNERGQLMGIGAFGCFRGSR